MQRAPVRREHPKKTDQAGQAQGQTNDASRDILDHAEREGDEEDGVLQNRAEEAAADSGWTAVGPPARVKQEIGVDFPGVLG